MKARRLGLIFSAEDGPAWMESHAAYPAPVLLAPDRLRIFLVARDGDNRGAVGSIDVDPADPRRVLAVSERPCLRPGAWGDFDDRGISIGSAHRIGGAIWLYYMGWNKSADAPFRNALGLALSTDPAGARFERDGDGPILDRSRIHPFTLSYPFVTPPAARPGGWSMIYGASRAGGLREEEMDHVLFTATSADGRSWTPSGAPAIELEDGEYGLSRPWLTTFGDGYYALYSIRRARYTVGVSRWHDAVGRWRRVSGDLLGPPTDAAAFDGTAQCYPATITVSGRCWLFYNGAGYGRSGLGLAALEA